MTYLTARNSGQGTRLADTDQETRAKELVESVNDVRLCLIDDGFLYYLFDEETSGQIHEWICFGGEMPKTN